MSPEFISVPVLALEILYLVSLVFLSLLGFHRYRLCWLYLKTRKVPKKSRSPAADSALPFVTVQIPVYNEVYVVKRVIEAVCSLDYPRGSIEIQVLDDSTDETSEIAREVIECRKKEGFAISHIRRRTRRGYKGGALREAFESARGEFIALFDADFVPSRGFLRRAVACFSDPSVGIAQARWGHINMKQSLLTRIQSVFLDGHFLIEQAGRSASGLFLNFNGTACVIRSRCLRSCGGWQDDTIAEDLDLSCRAQLNGWRIEYMRDLVCPAELPSDVGAFKSQQRRWAGGGIQNAKKFLPEMFSRKDLSLGFKTEAVFHMLGNFSSPVFLSALFSAVVINTVGGNLPEKVYSVLGAAAFAASGGIFAFYLLAALDSRSSESFPKKLAVIPLAIIFWAGISLNNTGAVISSLSGGGNEFVRTPKTASTGSGFPAVGRYGSRFDFTPLFELAVSSLLVFCALTTPLNDVFLKTLLFVFAAAFSYVSFLSLKQGMGKVCRQVLTKPNL